LYLNQDFPILIRRLFFFFFERGKLNILKQRHKKCQNIYNKQPTGQGRTRTTTARNTPENKTNKHQITYSRKIKLTQKPHNSTTPDRSELHHHPNIIESKSRAHNTIRKTNKPGPNDTPYPTATTEV
jgi:hypothetical protein